MNIIVADSYKEMSKIAATHIQQLVNEKENAVLGLATGSTPIGTYEELINLNKQGSIDFSNTRTVNLDEYIGLDGNHLQSYRYFMNDKLFNKINIKKENTYVPNGIAENIAEEARKYDEKIDELGGIDLQILGIGSNGHIAFNEPADSLKLNTHLTKLTEDTIKANARFFASLEEVPKEAITMGIGQIMRAGKILLLANGKNKVEAIKGILSGKITTKNPSTMLQLHSDVTLIIDKEIDEELKRL